MQNSKQKIYVAVTCDTEFLPPWNEGSWEDMATWSFEQGVPIFTTLIDARGIQGTYFTQATVIEQFPDIIRGLKNAGHLIGSHGYNHENYGDVPVKVWTPGQPVMLGDAERIHDRLERSLKIHREVLDEHPGTFVAPFDNTDARLTMILDNLGFKVDCSLHNYTHQRNSFPFYPLKDRSIIEIPLTVVKPEGSGIAKNLLEAFTYDRDSAKDCLKTYIEESAVAYPFCMVLITCHPYEFLDVAIPHPREILIVGQEKETALGELLDWLAALGANFTNPLKVAEYIKTNTIKLETEHVF